jgi:hypothetical protein
MPSREEAIRLLRAAGEMAAAEHVRGWRNRNGGTSGWDANLKLTYPSLRSLLWPDTRAGRPVAAKRRSRGRTPPSTEALRLARPAAPAFDAYVMIDWSASSVPNTGKDSIWWACVEWAGSGARLSAANCSTRAELVEHLRSVLAGSLREHRTLVGFDFPFGFPTGFGAALGHAGAEREIWRHVWGLLSELVVDEEDNGNNRLEVAAHLNRLVSGGRGPFYGRPSTCPKQVEETLSPRQRGCFGYPLRTLNGREVGRERLTDRRAGTKSSPWFVYGGGNSVGGQALVGIPRVHELRAAFRDARVWPFETGASLPERSGARVIMAEIYPSLFHTRVPGSAQVHDELQVEATAARFASLDASGSLVQMFSAPPATDAVLGEEGWVLGAT